MNATQSQLIDLLKVAGLDVQLVEDEAQSDFDQSNALLSIDAKRSEIIRPQIEKEVGEKARKDAAGHIDGTLERMLKRTTGIDLKEFTPDMKWEDKVKTALEYKASLLEQDKQGWDKQLNEMLEAHKGETERIRAEYDGKLTEAQQRYIDRDITDAIFGSMKDAPIANGADRGILAGDVKQYLNGKYTLKYNEETKALDLYDKADPNVPALDDKKANRITLIDEIKNYATPRGLWATDTRGIPPKDVVGGNGQQQGNNAAKIMQPTTNAGDKKAAFMAQLNEAAAVQV